MFVPPEEALVIYAQCKVGAARLLELRVRAVLGRLSPALRPETITAAGDELPRGFSWLRLLPGQMALAVGGGVCQDSPA